MSRKPNFGDALSALENIHEDELKELNDRVSELEKDVEEKDAQIELLKEQIKIGDAELSALQESYDDLKDEVYKG